MTCDSLLAAFADGRPLSAAEAAHLRGCASCRRLAGALEARPLPAARAPAPTPPGAPVLTHQVRMLRAKQGGAVLLAAIVLATLVPALGPDAPAPTPAPAPLVAVAADTGDATADDEADDDAIVEDLDEAEVLAAADPASPADEALLAVMVHLDHLDDAPAELPGAGLVAMLDPYDDSPDPLLNLGDL